MWKIYKVMLACVSITMAPRNFKAKANSRPKYFSFVLRQISKVNISQSLFLTMSYL